MVLLRIQVFRDVALCHWAAGSPHSLTTLGTSQYHLNSSVIFFLIYTLYDWLVHRSTNTITSIFVSRLNRLTPINIRCGPGSSVGIATGYGMDGPGIESRWGARFSAPVQTGPGAHPASCTMGTGSLPGVKSGRGMTLTSHGHERVELYPYSPYGPCGLYRASVPVQG